MRILVVDDSPTFLAIASEAIEEAGYEVEVARSGDEAVKLAKVIKPDLIVMDIEMPYSGDKAAAALRFDSETCDIPIIAMTGVSPESLGDKASLFNDYLIKPFGLEELIPKIQKFIKK